MIVPPLQDTFQWRTGLGTVLPARELSSTAALKRDKIARRTLAYYREGDFGKYHKVQVRKLCFVMCLNDIVVRFHVAAALDLRLGVRIWKSECSSGF